MPNRRLALPFLSLRTRILLVVFTVALLPLVVVWLSGFSRLPQSTYNNLTVGMREVQSLLSRSNALPRMELERLARDHQFWLRIDQTTPTDSLAHFAMNFERTRSWWHQLSAPFYGKNGIPTLTSYDIASRLQQQHSPEHVIVCDSNNNDSLVACGVHFTVLSQSGTVYQVRIVDGWPQAIVSIYHRRYALLKVVFIVLIPAFLLAFWLFSRMIPPIELLRNDVLSRLDNPHRLVPIRTDQRGEIKDLAEAFNQLLQTLHQRRLTHRDFINDLAHELKNPVAAMAACIELMSQSQAPSQERLERWVSVLQTSNRRLSQIIGHFLEITRAETGFLTEEHSTIEIPLLITNMVSVFQQDERYRTVQFQVHTSITEPLQPCTVDGVLSRLESAIRNVIDNAASFAGENGFVRIAISYTSTTVVIAISDSGPGISAEHLPKIFDRFFTTRGSSTGTGLGLALTHAVITSHGGTITAISPPGEGATFTITLPLQTNHHQA